MWKPLQTIKRWMNFDEPVKLTDTYERNCDKKIRQELFGHRIVKVEGKKGDGDGFIYLDNGRRLRLAGNEGCGGCGNGWFYLTEDLDFNDNAIMNVEIEETSTNDEDFIYRLWIISANTKIKAAEFGGYDNGYYGTGFSVYVEIEEDDGVSK